MTKVEKADGMRDRIVHLLYENLEELIQNPYGNYAVQHALDVIFVDWVNLLTCNRHSQRIVTRFWIKSLIRLFNIPIRNSLQMLLKNV